MTARPYHGGVPAPPPEIAAAMGVAGKAGDQAHLDLLKDRYDDWLEERGYPRRRQGRPARADEAAR